MFCLKAMQLAKNIMTIKKQAIALNLIKIKFYEDIYTHVVGKSKL